MNSPRLSKLIFLITVIITTSCNNNKVEVARQKELKIINEILTTPAEKAQRFSVSTDSSTIVYGLKGTIISINPNSFEPVDSTEIGKTIDVELLELTTKNDFVFNNVQTVSNDKLLISGGAYYINMTSDGKQLRLKNGESLKVRFPKITEEDMELFEGVKDNLNQINWIPLNEKIETNAKTFEFRNAPEVPQYKGKSDDVICTNIELRADTTISNEVVTQKLTKEELKNYKKEVLEGEAKYLLRKLEYDKWYKKNKSIIDAYEAVNVKNLGWINCDRFNNDSTPKTNITLLIKDNKLMTARFYAVFKDINSVIIKELTAQENNSLTFNNIPKNNKIEIFALAVKDSTPFMFDQEINSSYDTAVNVDFKKTTAETIKKINFERKKIIKSVYPNPATGFCNLELINEGDYYFELLDNSGTLKMKEKINTINTKIDLENLSPATYFIRVFTFDRTNFEATQIIKI